MVDLIIIRSHEASLNVKLISIAIIYYIYCTAFYGPLRMHYSQIGIYYKWNPLSERLNNSHREQIIYKYVIRREK